jgi:hypothetical protein
MENTQDSLASGDSSPSLCSADFSWWSNKRGVWPRLTHDETFQAGWESCATRLWEVCTTDNESKEEFIARIKAIIHLPNVQAEPVAPSNKDQN